MKHLKQQASSFFRTVWKSLTDIRFYRGVRHKRLGEAAAYLAVLISVVWLVPFLIVFFVGARAGLAAFLDGFDRHVPAGTVFELKKGTFTNSLEAPIIVHAGGLTLVVNTATSTTALADKEFGVAIGQTQIVERDDDGQTQTVSLSKLPDFRQTKEQMLARVRSSAPWLIGFVALIALCAFAFASALVVAATSLFHAALLWFVMRLLKKPIAYREAWILAAYAITAMVIAKALLALLGMPEGGLPTVLYWVMLGFVAYDLCKVPGGGKGGPRDEQSQETKPDDRTIAGPPHA